MSKKNMYVVEDDTFFLNVITDDLSENQHYNVKGFSTAEQCIAELGDKPDLIVLDYYLDKDDPSAMNGLEALKKIHQYDPSILVIMLSGQESLSTADELLSTGANDYVIKDSDAIKILQRKITKLLGV